MRRVAVPLLLVAVAGLTLAFREAPDTVASPEGVWKAVEVTVTNTEGTQTNPITQPNLTILTAGHYASVSVFGEEPRALLPDEPTDEQRLAAWRPVGANAGTYLVAGSDITTTVIVAKSPNATAEHATNTSTFELQGEVMYRTFTNQSNGTTFKVKFVRQNGSTSPIDGVWKNVESTATNDQGTQTNAITQPNLTIFSRGHYATMRVTGADARPTLPNQPTDEQLLAAWRRFAANAGTFQISGSTLTTKVIVAKNPNATAAGSENTSTFEIHGDELVRTFKNQNTGTTFTVKYTRVK